MIVYSVTSVRAYIHSRTIDISGEAQKWQSKDVHAEKRVFCAELVSAEDTELRTQSLKVWYHCMSGVVHYPIDS